VSRPSQRRLQLPDTPEPSHGAIAGTLAGAAPPWIETWIRGTPPSELNDRAWVTTVHNDGLPADRRDRAARAARRALRQALRRRRFRPPPRRVVTIDGLDT